MDETDDDISKVCQEFCLMRLWEMEKTKKERKDEWKTKRNLWLFNNDDQKSQQKFAVFWETNKTENFVVQNQ